MKLYIYCIPIPQTMPKEIRTYWPKVTNDQVDKLNELSGRQWILVRRLCRDNRHGGKEISEKDLLQSMPPDKIGEFKKELYGLIKKQILVKKPKPTTIIYQSPLGFFDDTVAEFTDRIATDDELRRELMDNNVEFLKVSEEIMEVLINTHSKRKKELGGNSVLYPSVNKTAEGDLGVIAKLEFICPNTKNKFFVEFEILSVEEIYQILEFVECDCGAVHSCSPSGRII